MSATSAEPVTGPLSGIRVLDLSRVLSGPYATMALGDMGADVIKIEKPGVGDESREITPKVNGLSHYFASLNRNKRSVELELSSHDDRDRFLELCAQADVVVQNFRSGQVKKWGIDYEAVRLRNPRIVYCSISGMGDEGEMAHKPSFDVVAQAMSGLMTLNGDPDGPPMKFGIPLGDLAVGSDAIRGILAALIRRATTGDGTHVQVNLFSSLLALQSYHGSQYLCTGQLPNRYGNSHHASPFGVFRCSDGYLAIAAWNDKFWRNLCSALALSELAESPSFRTYADRQANRAACDAAIEIATAAWERAALLAQLDRHDVPCGPVLNVAESIDLAHSIAPEMIVEFDIPNVGRVAALGSPVRFSSGPNPPFRPPPALGQHTNEVLAQSVHSKGQVPA